MHEEENDPVTRLVKRNLVWDTLPCDMAASSMAKNGLIPGTPDSDELEHRWSHQRLNTLLGIYDLVTTIAGLAGEIAGRAILEAQDIEVTEEQLFQYANFSTVTGMALVANLITEGVLIVNNSGVVMF